MAGKDIEKKAGGELAGMDAELLARMQAAGMGATDDIDDDDIQLPMLSLVQKMSRYTDDDDAKPGTFINSLTREKYDSPEFVIAMHKKTRTRFSKEIGTAPLCQSPNALDGYGDPGDQLAAEGKRGPNGGGACKVCPHAVLDFQTGEIGDCALQHNYIGFVTGEDMDPTESMPVAAVLQRTSMKTAKTVNTMLKTSPFPWAYVYQISSTTKENKNGKYAVWEMKRTRKATPEEMMRALELAEQIKAASSLNIQQDIEGDEIAPGPGGDNDVF